MAGQFPFKDGTSQKVLLKSKEQLDPPRLPFSSDVQDCMAECLRLDASKRAGVKDILDKPFVQPCIMQISDQVVERNR